MIVAKLKESFHTAESITLEFTGLMRSTFAYYSELQTHFHEQLPEHLHQSQLISLLNADIKPRLFNHSFCERIQESLKALRRAIIRLEDFRAAHPELPEYVNNLETLTKLGERVEALYQKHWEYYRYQSNVTEQELVTFLLEVDRIGYEWDVYLEGFSAAGGLVRAMGGEPPPENTGTLRVATCNDGNPATGDAAYDTRLGIYDIAPVVRTWSPPLSIATMTVRVVRASLRT